METETKTKPRVAVEQTVAGRFRLTARNSDLYVTGEELQAIVQLAGDRFGIIAQPWTDR